MSITNDTKLPSEEELKVDQEITLSTPWMKAVAPYMARACEFEVKEFMLRRKELEDPRLVLKEGAAVTNCGIAFLQKLKKTCAPEVEKEEQRFLDRCIEENLKIERPKLGYFSKLHVHESVHPRPERKMRDYHKEAAEILNGLPADYHLRKDYRRFTDWRTSLTEN